MTLYIRCLQNMMDQTAPNEQQQAADAATSVTAVSTDPTVPHGCQIWPWIPGLSVTHRARKKKRVGQA